MALIKPNPPSLNRGHPLNRGLVGAWLFTEGAGGRVNDASGYGNHGTIVAAPKWTGNSFGSGLILNGTSQYIVTPTNGIVTANRASCSLFLRVVQPAPPADYIRLVSLESGAGVGFFIFVGPAASPYWFFQNGGNYVAVAYSTAPSSLLMVYDGSTVFVYVNGKFVSSLGTTTNEAQSSLFYIGSYAPSPTIFWPGTINEARFYNRALSEFEAYQLYQSDYSEFRAPRRVVLGAGSVALAGAASLTLTPAAVLKGAAAAVGAASLTLTPAAVLKGNAAVVGAASLTLTPAAVLKGNAAVAGAAALVLTPSAALLGAAGLAGISALTFTPAADLNGTETLAASASFTFTPTAILKGDATLAGAAALVLSPAADVRGVAGLPGTASLTFTPAGDLRGASSLAAAAALAFTPSANLVGASAIAAASALLFTPVANLAIGGAGDDLEGSSALSFALSGDLVGDVSLAGAANLAFAPAGAVVGTLTLSGAADVLFVPAADLTITGGAAAAIGATFSTTLAMAISLAYHGIPGIHGRVLLPLFGVSGAGAGGGAGPTTPPGPLPTPPLPTVSLTPGYQYSPVAPPVGPGVTPALSAWALRLVDAVNNTQRGKMNVTLMVTLTVNAASTLVVDSRISAFSALTLMPMTSSAAAEQAAGTLYFSSRKSGEAVLEHANSAVSDRAFRLIILA